MADIKDIEASDYEQRQQRRKKTQDDGTMIDLLIEWGKWARHGYGYYSSPLYKIMQQHNPKFRTGWYGDAPQITDDDALRVDKAVCELARLSPVLANVLKLRYVNDCSLREISRYYLTPLEYPEQASMDWRAGLKDGNSDIQDLQKAAWYIQDEIKRLQTQNKVV